MFNLMIGSQYKRLEIMQMFDPNIKNYSQSGYWSKHYAGKIYYLIFCNVGVTSTKINGKKYDYPNKKINEDEFIWCSRNGVNLKNNKLLDDMSKNPERILLFYREKSNKKSLYTYFGMPKIFDEIYSSQKNHEPSTFRIGRYTNEKNIFKALKLKTYNYSMRTLKDLIDELNYSNNSKTGLKGEYLINSILNRKFNGIEKIEKKLGIKIDSNKVKWWYLENKRKNRDFDVHDFFLEIKSSDQKIERFFLSENEMKFMKKNINKYFIVLVNNGNNTFKIKTWKEVRELFSLSERRINVLKKI